MRREVGLVREYVGGKWDARRREGSEIGAGRFHAGTKISKEVFSLDGPMTASANLELHATAGGPTRQHA